MAESSKPFNPSSLPRQPLPVPVSDSLLESQMASVLDSRATPSPPSPPPSRWEQILSQFSPQTRFRLQQPGKTKLETANDDSESRQLFRQLSPAAQAASRDDQEWPIGRKPGHLLFEFPEGDAPTVRIFRSAEAMLHRMKANVGNDVHCYSVYGVLQYFSEGPDWIIFLHDDTAFRFHPRVVQVDEQPGPLKIQEDGFLGGPELVLNSRVVTHESAPPPRRPRRPPVEHKDEGEDESGSPVDS
jgi:hypothetical protein